MIQLLTVKEMAAALRISATTAYQLVESGKVPCHRVGTGRGSIRINQEDLDLYVEQCRSVPKPTRKKPVNVRLKHLSVSKQQNHR